MHNGAAYASRILPTKETTKMLSVDSALSDLDLNDDKYNIQGNQEGTFQQGQEQSQPQALQIQLPYGTPRSSKK